MVTVLALLAAVAVHPAEGFSAFSLRAAATAAVPTAVAVQTVEAATAVAVPAVAVAVAVAAAATEAVTSTENHCVIHRMNQSEIRVVL